MKMTLTAWEILAVEKALSLTWQRNDEPIEVKGLMLLIERFSKAKYVTIETK